MRLIGFILLVLIMGGCTGKRALSALQPTLIEHTVDSVYTIERIVPRDTLIIVPSDSLKMRVSLIDLKENTPVYATSKSGKMEVKVVREADTLIVDCAEQNRELWIALADKVKEIRRLRKHTNTIEIPVVFVPWWVKVLAWTGGLAIVLLAIGGIMKKF